MGEVDLFGVIASGLAEELNRHYNMTGVEKHVNHWTISYQHANWCYSYITLYEDYIGLNAYSLGRSFVEHSFRYEDPQLFEQLLATLHKVEELSQEGA